MDELHNKNQSLEDNIQNIKQHQQEAIPIEEMEVLDHQPLSDKICEAFVSEGFKPSTLVKFDAHGDPYKHVASINTHMTIIWGYKSLKCKLLSGTFKEAALQ